jgi:glucokinase
VNAHGGADVIGLDLGGTFLKAARVAPDGTIGRRLREPVSARSADELLSQLARAVRILEEDGPVPAVGLGIPGIVERSDGRAHGVPNLPAIEGLPVGAELEARTGRRAFAVNDANAAALAESWLGAGRDALSLMLVTLGTGVGGGLVLDGALFTGLAGYAGEVGHIQVEPNGARCGCDSWGCIETIAGAGGWARRAEAALATRPSALAGQVLEPAVIVDAARRGDAVALEVLDGTARALGAGIAAVFEPPEPRARRDRRRSRRRRADPDRPHRGGGEAAHVPRGVRRLQLPRGRARQRRGRRGRGPRRARRDARLMFESRTRLAEDIAQALSALRAAGEDATRACSTAPACCSSRRRTASRPGPAEVPRGAAAGPLRAA